MCPNWRPACQGSGCQRSRRASCSWCCSRSATPAAQQGAAAVMTRMTGLWRMVLGALLALLIVGGTIHTAHAELVGQHDFVRICKQFGGTPVGVDTHVVRCTWPGLITTCNFDTRKCTDIFVDLDPGEGTGSTNPIGPPDHLDGNDLSLWGSTVFGVSPSPTT